MDQVRGIVAGGGAKELVKRGFGDLPKVDMRIVPPK